MPTRRLPMPIGAELRRSAWPPQFFVQAVVLHCQLEDHDLIAALSDRYRDYRGRVPMLIPGLRRAQFR